MVTTEGTLWRSGTGLTAGKVQSATKRRFLIGAHVRSNGGQYPFHPDERWMRQIARNVTIEGCGALQLRACNSGLRDLQLVAYRLGNLALRFGQSDSCNLSGWS
jgi:hypothetical protein